MAEEQTPGTEIATVEPPFSTAVASQQSRAVFLPANLAQAMQLAEYMASGIGVRQWMRGNPSACLALIQISMRWGMDPYIVSNKAYYANDTLSFESQLVNAVINTSGALIGRLKVEFSGDASGGVGKETLNCRVTGRLLADPDEAFVHEQALQTITIRNSPLWKVNPRQQLQYHATRAWARLYMPEVLLGIYTPDEIADGAAQQIEARSTPRDATPAPDRRNFTDDEAGRRLGATHTDCGEPGHKTADCSCFREPAAEEADFEEIETVLPKEQVVEGDGSGEALPEVEPEGEQTQREAGPETTPATTAAEPVDILDGIPSNGDEWSIWEKEVEPAIAAVTSRKQFDDLRRRLGPALEAAEVDLLNQVQEWLSDRLITIPEGGK